MENLKIIAAIVDNLTIKTDKHQTGETRFWKDEFGDILAIVDVFEDSITQSHITASGDRYLAEFEKINARAPEDAAFWSPSVEQYFDSQYMNLAFRVQGKLIQVEPKYRSELLKLTKLRGKKMKAIAVERDKQGMWTHPELPVWGENVSPSVVEDWFASQGLTHNLVLMDGELGERWGKGEINSCLEWEPAIELQDAFLVGIWDTEDGVVALFASPLIGEK